MATNWTSARSADWDAFWSKIGISSHFRTITLGTYVSSNTSSIPATRHQSPGRRTMSLTLKKAGIEEEVKKMRRAGIIMPIQSAWASPVVLVGKLYGSIRFCIDYLGLKAVTKPDLYPLPRMDDCLNVFGGGRMQQHGLRLKPEKCEFAKDAVAFLGHLVRADGLLPKPKRVRAIEIKTPANVTDVRLFLGFWRPFIQGYSTGLLIGLKRCRCTTLPATPSRRP